MKLTKRIKKETRNCCECDQGLKTQGKVMVGTRNLTVRNIGIVRTKFNIELTNLLAAVA